MLPRHYRFLRIPPLCSEISSTILLFTAGNGKNQIAETTDVTNRELYEALQLPIGDDVSGLHPLRSSATFCLDYGGIHSKVRYLVSICGESLRGVQDRKGSRRSSSTAASTV